MFWAMLSETDVWMSPIVTALSVFFFSADAVGFSFWATICFSSLFSTNLYAVRINFFET
jgi:hypothetical protein